MVIQLLYCAQASGEAKYTGSYGYGGSLHAYPVLSKRALATVESLDASVALQVAASEHTVPEWRSCLRRFISCRRAIIGMHVISTGRVKLHEREFPSARIYVSSQATLASLLAGATSPWPS